MLQKLNVEKQQFLPRLDHIFPHPSAFAPFFVSLSCTDDPDDHNDVHVITTALVGDQSLELFLTLGCNRNQGGGDDESEGHFLTVGYEIFLGIVVGPQKRIENCVFFLYHEPC